MDVTKQINPTGAGGQPFKRNVSLIVTAIIGITLLIRTSTSARDSRFLEYYTQRISVSFSKKSNCISRVVT